MRHRTNSLRTLGRSAALLLSLSVLSLSTGCQGNVQTPILAASNAIITGLANSNATPSASTSSPSFTSSSSSPSFNPFSSFSPTLSGGLSGTDGSNLTPSSANGVLNLPVMRQGDGGQEAAIRGCGPTSLLMATRHSNPSEIQGVLVQVCDRPGGLVADRAVQWLRSNGFGNSAHYSNWTVEQLRQETMVRKNPVIINFLNPSSGNGHIVVVTGVTDQGVHFNDPGPGSRRVLSVAQFESQWAARDEYAIPVRA